MYLGIDLGTSGVKALLIDAGQTIVASATSPLTVSRPHPGWSEQNPASWITATGLAIAELKQSHARELSAVKAIGLSGQMHGATLIGRNNKPLRPSILWNDTRSHKEAAELDANPMFREISGNIVFPGFTAPKLQWVKSHEPENFNTLWKVLLPKDYLRLWLTGEIVSDCSDASGTSWLDVKNRCWSEPLLAACDLDQSQMPTVIEGSEVGGTLRVELATEWGMNNNVVVAGGAGDNAASAIGMGTIEAGSAFLSLGTSGVLFAANDRYSPNPDSAVHAFCHAIPNHWHQMGVILAATDALNWYASITGKSAAILSNELGEELQPPGQAIFLPYLGGERTPHNDANIRAGFTGLVHSCSQQDLTRAVMEGVGFAFRDNLLALQDAGTKITRVTAVGGGSNSRYWLKAIASILNLPVDIPGEGDFGAAFGAARLAIIAAENADPSAICTPAPINQTIEPDAALVPAFDAAYQRYSSLYPALKELKP